MILLDHPDLFRADTIVTSPRVSIRSGSASFAVIADRTLAHHATGRVNLFVIRTVIGNVEHRGDLFAGSSPSS